MKHHCRKQKLQIGSNSNSNPNLDLGPDPDPSTTSSGVSKEQLSKFRELQRRRLQMASKSKKKCKRSSDVKDKILNEDGVIGSLHENMDRSLNDSSIGGNSKNDDMDGMSLFCTQPDVHPAFRKKKLHWGLDTKERWERKANM